MLSNGHYLITWRLHDGAANNTYAQLFDGSHNALGSEAQLIAGYDPISVSALDGGGFIMTYSKGSGAGNLYAQVFSNSLSVVGSEIQINNGQTVGNYIDVLGVTYGGFAVSYSKGSNYESHHVKIFNNSRVETNSFELQNVYANGGGRNNLIELSNGHLVSLIFENRGGVMQNVLNIFETSDDATSAQVGAFTRSSGYPAANIVSLTNGGFAFLSTDSSSRVLSGEIFDNTGNSVVSSFTISDNLGPHQYGTPQATSTADGGFIVSYTKTGSDGYQDLYARKYDSAGNASATEFLVNTGNEGISNQRNSSRDYNGTSNIAIASDGTYLFTYDQTESSEYSVRLVGTNSIGAYTTNFLQSSPTSNLTSISLGTNSSSNTAIQKLDTALEELNTIRASLGALSNRIDHIVTNNTNTATNIAKSISRIEDADFAAETTNLAKQQILQQAATAMLAQANASKQNILTLLNLSLR